VLERDPHRVGAAAAARAHAGVDERSELVEPRLGRGLRGAHLVDAGEVERDLDDVDLRSRAAFAASSRAPSAVSAAVVRARRRTPPSASGQSSTTFAWYSPLLVAAGS
jgi:hypothetical protein